MKPSSVIMFFAVGGFDPHSDSESSLRPALLQPPPGGPSNVSGSLNNDPSRSNSLMSETSSSQPDVHPFYKASLAYRMTKMVV